MVRVRVPGGVCSPAQDLVLDVTEVYAIDSIDLTLSSTRDE